MGDGDFNMKLLRTQLIPNPTIQDHFLMDYFYEDIPDQEFKDSEAVLAAKAQQEVDTLMNQKDISIVEENIDMQP
jgi:hypothetical protein